MTQEEYATVSDIVQFLKEYQNVEEYDAHVSEFSLNEECTVCFDWTGYEPYEIVTLNIEGNFTESDLDNCPNNINSNVDKAECMLQTAFNRSDFETRLNWELYNAKDSYATYDASVTNPYYDEIW